MRYYKKLDGEYIVLVGKGLGDVEIGESEYSQILAVIATKPSRTDITDYRLKSDLTWEQYQIEPEWVQPTGAHDAYAYGAKVTHNNSHWVSEIEANVYEPGVYGWVME